MDLNPNDLLNGAGVVGVVLLVFWALLTGRLCTGRELREKNQELASLRDTLRTRDHQLSLILNEAMTTINPVLKAMRAAVDAEEGGP